jgi:hypothetical protein
MTRLTEVVDEKGKPTGKFKALVDFPDNDPNTGEPIQTVHTPESAVKRMRELPAVYGGLFNSGVVGGAGSQAATGGIGPGGGVIDVRKLTQEQYMALREKNPAALGLRAPKPKR